MSYHLWLDIDTGGPEPAMVGRDDLNYTSNCSPMWRHAGADLADMDGQLASEATCLSFLRSLLSEFVQHPCATVRVDR